MEKYLQEAFKAFEELNEDVFDISINDGLEKAKEFEDEPVWDDREEEIIIDPLAETEEELEKDYIGKAILQCEICQSMIYKNPDEVVIDEETELANIDEVCPFCQSEDGFKVIGEIKEFCDDEECEEKHEEEAEESEEVVEEPAEEKSEEEIEVSSEEEVEEPIEDEDDLDESIKTRKKVRIKEECEEELDEAKRPLKRSGLSNSEKIKRTLAKISESTERDKIDADTDDKKEKAKSEEEKKNDDADSDRDYKLKRKGLKEAQDVTDQVIININEPGYLTKKRDLERKGYKRLWAGEGKICMAKPKSLKESDEQAATSIEDAQKWVDYDMKKYGKISERTNELVKKAGFQILKDDHGDYEVAAGKFESCEESLKENFANKVVFVDRSGSNSIEWDDNNKSKRIVDRIQPDKVYYFSEYMHDKIEDADKEGSTNYEDIYKYALNNKNEMIYVLTDSDYEDYKNLVTSGYRKDLRHEPLEDLDNVKIVRIDLLKEDFNKVDIETDTQKMSMESDESGKVTVTTEPKTPEIDLEAGTEVIAPVSDEVKAEFKSSEEVAEEEPEEIDYDFDEFEEKDFDSLGEGFLRKVYENVKSFKTTEGRLNGNNLMLEGLITFKSGKQAKTNFIFEAYKATKTGKLKFIGENKQFAKGKKSFTLSGRADGKKLVCESLNYNYVAKSTDGNSKRLYGTIKK